MAEMTWTQATPKWVVPPLVKFKTYGRMAFRLEEITGCWQARGQCAAVCWLVGLNCTAPMTDSGDPVTVQAARRESWLALGVAAGYPAATDRARAWLGLPPFRIVAGSQWWAHGVWRTLSWAVGDRPDPPIVLPVLAEDGSMCPGTHVYAMPRQPDAAWWRGSEARRERRELAEASQAWRANYLLVEDLGGN
jgi:hypothetical protein